jgi:hypothetical protein
VSPLLQALESGYPAEEIISYISKALPQMAPAINKAKRSGYGVKEIIGFLSKNFDTEDRRGMSESQRHAANKRADALSTKHGLALAATAVAAPLAASAVSSALSRALPNPLKNMTGQALAGGTQSLLPPNQSSPSASNPLQSASVSTQQMPQEQNLLQSSSQQPPNSKVESNIPQPTETVQPKGISDKLWESVEKGRLTDRDPNISAFLKVANSLRKTRGLSTKEQFDNLYEVFENKREMGLEGPALARELFAEWDQMKEPQTEQSQEIGKPRKIEKSSIVASPNGMGEVKEIRNGKALIDVDGKTHKVDEDELISSPLPEKDLSDLYDDLIKGVETETGEDVSRMVDWAGYDPNTGKLAFLPHDGGLYTYSNLSQDEVDQLTDILSTRKSSGSNFIGAWKAGSKSPIGAAMSALIKKLQSERGGKGNEYLEKFETVYKALEPAIKAAKKKKKK